MADYGWGQINQGVNQGLSFGLQLGAIKRQIDQFNEAKRQHNMALGEKLLAQSSALRKVKTEDAKRQAFVYQKMAMKILGPELGLSKDEVSGLDNIDYDDNIDKYSDEMDKIFQSYNKGDIDLPTAQKLFSNLKQRFTGELDVEGQMNAIKSAKQEKESRASAEAIANVMQPNVPDNAFNVPTSGGLAIPNAAQIQAMQSTESGRTTISNIQGAMKEASKLKLPTSKQQEFEFLKAKFPDKSDEQIADMVGWGIKNQKYASKIWNLTDERDRAKQIYGENSEVVKGINREIELAKKEGVKYIPAGKTEEGADVWRIEGQKGYFVAGPNGEDIPYEGPMKQARERQAIPSTWDKMRESAIKALAENKNFKPSEEQIAKKMNEMYKGQSLLQLLLGGTTENPLNLNIQ